MNNLEDLNLEIKTFTIALVVNFLFSDIKEILCELLA